LLGVVGLDVAEDVRVAAHQLLVDGRHRVIDVERSLFARDLGDEDGLQQEVAELLAEVEAVVAVDGVDDLVRLLDDERLQRRQRLLAVPRTAVRPAQLRHELHELFEGTFGHAAILLSCYDPRSPQRRVSMPNNVLIVASDPAAKAPAEVAAALSFTPVVASTEQEALALLDRENFTLIAVSGASASPRLREEAERKQPMARLLELPEARGEELRSLMVRYLDRRAPQRFAAEERYRFLSTILESFTTTLELKEVLRRIVTITREEFAADRAWLLQPINETAE